MASSAFRVQGTCAYLLLLDLGAAIPSRNSLRHTEFATIRLRLLKIAARIIEHASRIRIALASCCPGAQTFSLVVLKLQPEPRSLHPQRVDSVIDSINLPSLGTRRTDECALP